MSYTETIILAMRTDVSYTPEEISQITHIDEKTVREILKMLVRNNLIELISEERYKRKIKRRYRTKQLGLSI